MQRLRDERGGVAVIMALLIVPLIGFAAVAVDVAAMWSEKQQLQTAADASALAIAQDCARDECGDTEQTAQELTNANMNDGEADVDDVEVASGRANVHTSGVREHWFAPVLGFDESTLTADATAKWGVPTGGTAMLPLALHECEFQAQVQQQGGDLDTSTPAMLKILSSKDLKKKDLPDDWPCEMPNSGNHVPGGFGWLDPDPGTCRATSVIMDHLESSDPGKSMPSDCQKSDLVALRHATFLLPLFDDYGGQGNSAWYDITGYAAFTLKGYSFVGKAGHSWGVGCGSNACISGHFVEFVDLTDAFDYGVAPDYGAAVVSLTD